MTAITPPELPKLIVNASGRHKYVFTYKNRWDAEKKRACRGKGDSKCVGKLLPVEGKEDCGEIIFNEEFKTQYPELNDLRVLRYKGGRLEFKPVDDDTHSIVRAGGFERLHAGATWALNQLLAGTPLMRALQAAFPEYKMHSRLLSLAYYLVINRDSSLCNYEEFAECTWVPYSRGLTSGSISRLLGNITKHRVSRFLQELNKAYVRFHGSEVTEARRFWALNSTSITSYSENISSVEYGHNKDLIDAPQTNVLLIVDQKTGEPVYYRNFDGNVPDVCTVRNTLAELAMLNISTENVVLVTYKGYCSNKNWEDMLRSSVSFICNARRNMHSAVTTLINENYHRLVDWNNKIEYIGQNAVTIPIEWVYDEYPVKGRLGQKNARKTLYFHLYYSKEINDEIANRLSSNLADALRQLRSDPDKLTETQRKLIADYTTEADGKTIISMSKVDEKLRYAGVRVLVSDTITDPLECCVAYEERNQVEHAFNTLKARLSCNRTGVHSTKAWEGKLFLQMLASAIAGMVRARVKIYNESAVRKKCRVHYDSDYKLLARLNNVYMTKCRSGWIFDEVVGKKKELFRVLGVPVPTAEQVFERDEVAEAPEEVHDIEELAAEMNDDGIDEL